MGYKFRDSVGADKKESAAVMGGAVVAVLTSWADPAIRSVVEASGLMNMLLHDDDDVEQYSTTRFKVVQRINDAFVYSLSANQRPPKNVGQEWGRECGVMRMRGVLPKPGNVT